MGKFTVENDFATPFGTTTSDGFHADADAIRFEPDVKSAIDGMGADGKHASVETALKKRAQAVKVNGTTYTATYETGLIDLGEIVTDISDTISGITMQSGTTTGITVNNRKASITLAPATLKYNNNTGSLTIVDQFGVSGSTIELGLDKFVQSGTYDASTKKITLAFNDKSSIQIPVDALVKEYSGDGKTIEYVNGTLTAFTLVASAKTALNNVSVISGNLNTVSGKVTTNTTNIATVSGNLNTVSGKVNTNTTNISTVSGNLNTLSGKVTTNTTNIATNTTNIGTVSGKVSTIESKYLSGVSIGTSALTVTNKVAKFDLTQAISSASLATQIPSNKAVYDYCQPLTTAQKTELDNIFSAKTNS